MKTMAIITSNFPPANIVGALRPFRLTKFLCKGGWKVVVFTRPPTTGHDLDSSLLEEIKGDFDIHYVTPPDTGNSWNCGLAARFIGAGWDVLEKWIKPDSDVRHVFSYYKSFNSYIKANRVDVVLTTSPPHSIHLAGLMVKKKHAIPWIVDFRDPWDDYPTKGHHELSLLDGYFERSVITRADSVISATKTYSKNLIEKHSAIDSAKFHVVTNSYDKLKTSLYVARDPKHFIICYTGIFYSGKDPYAFFRAMKSWFDKMSPSESSYYKSIFRVHLIGSGDTVTRQVIRSLGLEDVVIFFERMSHEHAIEKTLEADMVLISTGQAERTRPGWLPSKLFEYLGCRIPILALIREGEMAEVIRSTKSGYILLSEDHDKVREILENEIRCKFKHEIQSDDARFIFEGIDRFEEENVMRGFTEIIENTLSRSRKI
ncbi:MAG: glycosyltransferase [Desulfuromonadaceae bacterium]|nr:glycosyltransferase [Desulfuromonadaceae bacterium]